MLDFFCSGIQFFVLLSHSLCVIFLYLDLHVVGDGAYIGLSCKPNIYVA